MALFSQEWIPPRSVARSLNEAVGKATCEDGICEVVIARSDGIVIAHNMDDIESAQKRAAMGATLVGTARMVFEDMGSGSLRQMVLAARDIKLLCVPAGAEALVSCSITNGRDIESLLAPLRVLAQEVEETIASEELFGIPEE